MSSTVNPTKGDPLASLFSLAKKGLARAPIPQDLALGISVALLFFGSVSIASFVEGVFLFSSRVTVTFVEDVAAPVLLSVLDPLVIIFIIKYYERLSDIFTNVERYVLVPESQKSLLVCRIQAVYGQKPVILCSAALFVLSLITVFFYFRYTSMVSYFFFVNGLFSASGVLLFIWTTLTIYFISAAALKAVLTIFALRVMFTYPLRYQEMHSDGVAGIGAIGRMIVHLSWLIVVVALIISILVLADSIHLESISTFRVMATNIPYVVLAPLLPLAPLIYAHSKMKAQKIELISKLAGESGARTLDSITAFYAVMDNLPEWPIKTTDPWTGTGIIVGIFSIAASIAAILVSFPI